MAITARVKTWISGDTLTAADLNAEFNAMLNGGINLIQDANIPVGAAITPAKIAGTAATLTGTEVLTNKTLTKPLINASVPGQSSYSPSAAATATLDLSNATTHTIAMPAGNITIALSSPTTNQWFTVEIVQDNVGSRTVTWFTTIRWVQGTAPVLTTTANKKDTFVFRVTGSNTYDGYFAGFSL